MKCNVIAMIVACSFATMISRILPLFVHGLDKLPKYLRKCMLLLPIAALGALLFPVALTDFGSQWYAGLVGIVLSFIVSYFGKSMIVSIGVALLATTLMLLI